MKLLFTQASVAGGCTITGLSFGSCCTHPREDPEASVNSSVSGRWLNHHEFVFGSYCIRPWAGYEACVYQASVAAGCTIPRPSLAHVAPDLVRALKLLYIEVSVIGGYTITSPSSAQVAPNLGRSMKLLHIKHEWQVAASSPLLFWLTGAYTERPCQ